MKLINIEGTNYGLVVNYTTTFNRNHFSMTGVEEVVGDFNDKLDIKEQIELGEECLLELNDSGNEKKWSLGFNENNNYNWLEQRKLKANDSYTIWRKIMIVFRFLWMSRFKVYRILGKYLLQTQFAIPILT